MSNMHYRNRAQLYLYVRVVARITCSFFCLLALDKQFVAHNFYFVCPFFMKFEIKTHVVAIDIE